MKRAPEIRLLLLSLLSVACDAQVRFEEPADAGAAARPRCAVDADCGLSTLHCDAVSGACVACVTDAHCMKPEVARCDPAQQRCVGCIADPDCGVGRACQPVTHRCVPRCSAGETCPPVAPFCASPALVCVRCRNDDDCVGSESGPTCDTSAGHCVACLADAQCGGALPRCERGRGTCVACLGSEDCPVGTACDPLALTCL